MSQVSHTLLLVNRECPAVTGNNKTGMLKDLSMFDEGQKMKAGQLGHSISKTAVLVAIHGCQ